MEICDAYDNCFNKINIIFEDCLTILLKVIKNSEKIVKK